MSRVKLTREDTKRGSLILVTPAHALAEEGRPKAAAPVGTSGVFLERKAAAMLQRLLLRLGSGGRIVPVSGLRSHEEQIRIWEETLEKEGALFTKTYVAKPGHSEHESGLAIDLAKAAETIDFICPEFPRDGICGTFRKLAPRYGFVERYPAGKEDVTGIGAEPWHFRYVGAWHGMAMEREGLILEDYIAFLKESAPPERPYLCPDPESGACAEIFYVDLYRTQEYAFRSGGRGTVSCSGTNEGGIVICRRTSGETEVQKDV